MDAPRAACAAVLAAAAHLPAAALDVQVEAGVQAHRLREFAAGGAKLVREQGIGPAAQVRAVQPLSPQLDARYLLGGWAARADYDGGTQGGSPVQSRTDTQSATIQASLRWRPPAAPGASLEAGLQVEHFRRAVRGAGGASGLDERLTQPRWLLRAGYATAQWDVAAGVVWGDRGRLSVRFEDDVFDRATLRSGQARGLSFEASRSVAAAWRMTMKAELLEVGASRPAELARDAVVVGTVSQPRWRRERIGLTLERAL